LQIKNKRKLHIWTNEEKEYLKEVTPGHHYKEIHKLFNGKFNLNLTIGQIKAAIGRYKLSTGFNGYFQKGNIPHNKGTKGLSKPNKTSFKKGCRPSNYREVGSERVTKDGYIEIKVEEPNKWRLKHQVIWEKYNGKIPIGHVVIFGDGNKENLDINNLILITRKQLFILNRNSLIKDDIELTKVAINIAKVQEIINEKDKLKAIE
jgi:hypothetical protein